MPFSVFPFFSSEVLSSSREYLPPHQGRRGVFRKAFNLTVQRSKYCLLSSIIRAGQNTSQMCSSILLLQILSFKTS